MTIKMSPVQECTATDCAYNHEGKCRTMAINVGDNQPACDTYMPAQAKSGMEHVIGGVGSCKVAGCVHNDELECKAEAVKISRESDGVLCRTFST